MPGDVDRRTFLGASAGGMAMLGMAGTGRTRADVKAADAAARRTPKPAHVSSDPVDGLRFATPGPQPGGQVREYWVQARTLMWDIVPTGRDDWMNTRIPARRRFRAYAYQLFSPGFAKPLAAPSIPGPTLVGEVGDVIVVHVRNGDERLGQAITMHPHGVRYTPDYDGTYLGAHTRAGGFIGPGEEFQYTWECVPASVGVWPYHDHGPNHIVNTTRGLFGALIVRAKGATAPAVETVLYQHGFTPDITGLDQAFECTNGHSYAGNTPTVRAKVGDDVAWHVFGGDAMFHTFHIHGHRWQTPAGDNVDNPNFGPLNSVTARYTEDNPGRWLYHCHVNSHQMGMAGWYFVDE